ncbi:MAG: aminotransferase class I/II-fold pyridoxal phosphate-dependent enzyme [Thiovulaceae bacterium]|nr:aminotransferase class I/II-fold pyridoxal phosphate-dependent enzyme [Sulfurimonadaceae bacterium]
MNFYEKELAALHRSGRYRERRIFDESIIDMASNDYLGLAHNREILEAAIAELRTLESHASKASMLVNGYTKTHQNFERALCVANGFEEGVILGSGFNANIALIETLVRKGDALFMDEKYHASGMLAAKLIDGELHVFPHNDASALETLLKESGAKRKIIAVEGIYSMDGDLLSREIIDLADSYNALLILDEAHSSGVIGEKLMGVLDHYQMEVRPNYIKMGTLGKAYGSFGAYVLASAHIVDFLVNRAKPIIYATAPSLFDTLLGHHALRYIQENSQPLSAAIKGRQAIVKAVLGIEVAGLIVPILVKDNRMVMAIQKELLAQKILVGAIRQPTVPSAIIRFIARLGLDEEAFGKACEKIKEAL